MKLLGVNWSPNAKGETVWTLHVAAPFAPYYSDEAAGRDCAGVAVETIYAGSYDCSDLRVGQDIEIYYDKAVKMKNGNSFQPVKFVRIIEEAD